MKKIFSIVMMAGLFSMALFAEDFIVSKTAGKVDYEASNGVFKELKVGDKVTSQTVIKIALHASVELTDADGKVHSIKAMKSGPVDSFITKGTGLKKASIAAAGKVNGDGGLSNSVSTASNRASEAKEDLSWDE